MKNGKYINQFGSIFYYKNGKKHRIDGPAVIHKNGMKNIGNIFHNELKFKV